jgi:hypothetical protein
MIEDIFNYLKISWLNARTKWIIFLKCTSIELMRSLIQLLRALIHLMRTLNDAHINWINACINDLMGASNTLKSHSKNLCDNFNLPNAKKSSVKKLLNVYFFVLLAYQRRGLSMIFPSGRLIFVFYMYVYSYFSYN